MKKQRQVSTCPKCGKKANISRKYVRAKRGVTYYYIRFYHTPSNIHFLQTDSSYSNFPIVQKKAKNLYSTLADYITRSMGPRKYTYTSLKKEIEKSFGEVVYNEEFNRTLKKAISAGILERVMEKNKPSYIKIPEVNLEERVKFNQVAVNFDFSSKLVRVSTFLEPINKGQIPLKKIPYFIPYGTLNSLDCLNLRIHDETDEILQQDLYIVFSTALETVFSIPLNRTLENEEKDFVFLNYVIPAVDQSTSFLALATIDTLRITVIAEKGYDARILRTLVDGVKETEISFPRHCFYRGNRNCFQAELDRLLKGENVSVRLIERQTTK